jgi:hypothetical protein
LRGACAGEFEKRREETREDKTSQVKNKTRQEERKMESGKVRGESRQRGQLEQKKGTLQRTQKRRETIQGEVARRGCPILEEGASILGEGAQD